MVPAIGDTDGPKLIEHARKRLPETVYTWALNAFRARSLSNPDRTLMDPTVDLLAVCTWQRLNACKMFGG